MCYQHLIEIPLNNQSKQTGRAITYTGQQLREIRNNIKDTKPYLQLNPGTIRKVRACRINRRKVTSTDHQPRGVHVQTRGVNIQNLITIRTEDTGGEEIMPHLKIATLNARSVKNKDQFLLQELIDNNIDIGLITETWLKDTQEDEAWINQSALQQNSYNTWLHNRPNDQRGGGLALIHKKHIPIKELKKGNTPTIEYGVWKATARNKAIHLVGIYHPPPSTTNRTTTGMFIDEITEVLTDIVPKYPNLIILGDFNISTEKVTSPDTVIFNDTMAALGLQQHVQGPTHKMGNTLDLIFSQLEPWLTVTGTTTHSFVSDHCMVSVELSLKKPRPPIVRKVIRDCSKITPQTFGENYTNPNCDEDTTLEEAHNLFEEELLKALNRVAPLKAIKCTNRQKHPWHNQFIKDQKRVVKNREKIWRRYQQEHQWLAYKKERNAYNRLLTFQKKQTLSELIKNSGKDTKKLFDLVNNLTSNKPSNKMPEGQSDGMLAKEFATFFLDKIENIRNLFTGIDEFKPAINDKATPLENFSPLTCDEVQKEVMGMKNKTCELDHIPTQVLKQILPTILGAMTDVVNRSLLTGSFAHNWKTAIVKPLLKKPGLGLEKKNYRPVSNLSFLSKLVEQCMLKQLLQHCEDNHLLPNFQSAYQGQLQHRNQLS